MKKILFALSVLSLFIFMSCSPAPTVSGDDNSYVNKWGSLEAKKIYNSLLGTWNIPKKHELASNGAVPVTFASDSVTLGTTKYTINLDQDLILTKDYLGPDKVGSICIKLNDRLLNLDINENSTDEIDICYLWWNLDQNSNSNWLEKVSGSGSGGIGDTSSVNGSYAFKNASGDQSNGTIILLDGKFTYNGGKNQAPSSGTYTVNNSDITFNWTANNYSVSTTVTMSKDGSSVTFSSNEVLFFSTFFGSSAQSGNKYSLTFDYTE